METIRVTRIIARLNVGGPAIHVTLLARHMEHVQHLLVFGTIGAEEGDMSYMASDVRQVIIPELGREISPLRDLWVLFKLVRLLRRERPQIVHTHTAKAGLLGRLAAWLARVPVCVHTFHGHVFRGYFGTRKAQVFVWLERLMARISTRIIAISPTLKNELVSVYRIAPAERFTVIPLGLDLKPLTTPPDDSRLEALGDWYSRLHNKRVVGIIGRLVPVKNHALFLEAAAKVGRDDAHFLIVGDGECRLELEAQADALGLRDRVTFTGWVKDIPAVLHMLDVFTLTSTNEGTPVTVIEAMAAGVPVVATDVGGVSDTLAGHGITVQPGDVLALASAIRRVLDGDHPDTGSARASALNRFGISRLVTDLETLYSELWHSVKTRS